MKRVLILILAIAPMWVSAQAFEKYEQMSKVDRFTATPKVFEMLRKTEVGESDSKTQEYKNLIENLEMVQTFSTSDAGIRKEMSNDVNSYLKANTLEELMSVTEDGKNIKFYIKNGSKDDYIRELLMFMDSTGGDKPQSVIMRITGNVSLSQLLKLTKDLNIPGANELNKANQKS